MPVATDAILRAVLQFRDDGFSSGFRKADSEAARFAARIASLEQQGRSWGTASRFAGDMAARLATGLGAAGKQAASMEQLETGFTSLLGSAEKANAMIGQLHEFDRGSPFDFQQSAQGAKRILGMGIAADQVIPVMRALGNAVSATGGSTEQFEHALTAIGQIASKGKLQGDELLQLAEAGVPLKEMLAELGTSMGEAGKKGITSEQAIAALIKTMSGGRFGGAMEAQSKTFNGAASNLKSATGQLGAAIGKDFLPAASAVVRFVTGMVDAVNQAPGPVKTLIGVIGGGVTLALLGFAARAKYVELVVVPGMIRKLDELASAHLRSAAAAEVDAAAQSNIGMAAGKTPGGLMKPGGLAGKLGGLGKTIGRNLAGGATLAALDFGIQALPGDTQKMPGSDLGADTKRVFGRAAGGGATGYAVAGPIGALVGALAAVGMGLAEDVGKINAKGGPKTTQEKILAELEKQTKTLEKVAGQGGRIDNRRVAGARQASYTTHVARTAA